MQAELLDLLPPIRRIRGNRLYAADRRRFLDLWLDDGRGILGEGERSARLFALNALDKGLGRPYPGLYDARFRASIRAAYPQWPAIRIYHNDDSLAAALVRLTGGPCAPLDAGLRSADAKPGLPAGAATDRRVALLRPFAPEPQDAELAVLRLPCSRAYSPSVLAARSEAALAGERDQAVPQAWLHAAARALDSLAGVIAQRERDGYGPAVWARWDRRMSSCFNRIGPYLAPSAEALERAGSYRAFFERGLEGGALLSPNPASPSVIPPDFDDGELVKLARALESRSGLS